VGANGRTGPVRSHSSEIPCIRCPVVSDWSGGVGLVCGMKRGISELPVSLLNIELGPSTIRPTTPAMCNLVDQRWSLDRGR
jgi:hypothetical protein